MVDFKCLKELHEDDENFCETWEKLLQKQPFADFYIIGWLPIEWKPIVHSAYVSMRKSRLLGIDMEVDLLAIWGVTKTMARMKERYYWPQLKRDVAL